MRLKTADAFYGNDHHAARFVFPLQLYNKLISTLSNVGQIACRFAFQNQSTLGLVADGQDDPCRIDFDFAIADSKPVELIRGYRSRVDFDVIDDPVDLTGLVGNCVH